MIIYRPRASVSLILKTEWMYVLKSGALPVTNSMVYHLRRVTIISWNSSVPSLTKLRSSLLRRKKKAVVVVAVHKQHKKNKYTLDNIPEVMTTKQVDHCLEVEDLVYPQCGNTMTAICKEAYGRWKSSLSR